MRYGLRRQLLLNLGVVMLLSSFVLGLFVMQVARVRFLRDRFRHFNVVGHLIHQTVLTRLSMGSRQIEGILSVPGGHGKMSRPYAGVVVLQTGRIWRKFGPVPRSTIPKLRRWLGEKREVSWQHVQEDNKSLFERVVVLRVGLRRIGVLWLRWDLAPMEREFFSFQALLYSYLTLFCFVILVILLVFLERRLVNPLRRLGEAFQRLAGGRDSGGLDQEVVRGDELGEIASLFLEMERVLKKQASERERHIEELSEANATLARAQEELVEREKMATIGRMAAGVAHEVGNPLSAIMGYSDLLRTSKVWGEVERDLAERVFKETHRIDRIIRDLLDYARPVSVQEPGEIRRSVEEALEILSLQKRFLNMRVEQELEENLPLVELSTSRLVQVLLNLLLNAADASGESGVITICGKREEGGVRLSVLDDGPGIPKELQDRLFEPFFTTKAPGQGIGLGLALTRRLLTSAGGTIEIDKGREKGAGFRVFIPLLSEVEEEASEEG